MNETTAWQRLARAAGSLKLRMALMGALLIAASVAVSVWWVLREVGVQAERVALDGQQAQTQRLARTMSNQLVRLQLALRHAAGGVRAEQVNDPQAMDEFFSRMRLLTQVFSDAAVIDRDGRVAAHVGSSSLRRPDLNLGDREYFQRTLRQKRPIISDAVTSRLSGHPIVVLTMPILDASGEVAAVLAAGMELRGHSLLESATAGADGDSAITVVTDASARILSHPDPNWLLRNAAEEPRLAGAVARWNAQGRPIELAGDAALVGGHVVATAGIPDADWLVLRSVPESVLLRSMVLGRARAAEVGFVVALLGGIALLGLTYWMLTPLRQLEQRAQRLRDPALADDEGWPRASGEIGRLSRVFREVMQQRRQDGRAQVELVERVRAVMAHAPVGICFTRDKRFELVSTRFNRLLGYDDPGLVGQSPRVIYGSDEFYAELGERVGKIFAAGMTFDEEIEFMRRDGSRFWGRLQGTPVRAGDAAAGTIWTLDDVTRTRRQREALSWSSTHDALTQLVNRAEFERRLRALVGNRRRFPVSALFIDLDHFKAINDTAGHAAGDRVLIDIARLFGEQVREDDTVARLGGDEFAVLLQGCERDNAARVAEKMRAAVESYRLPWKGRDLTLGASFGVVELDASVPTLEAVMAAADAACYDAKRAGRNAIRVHRGGALSAPAGQPAALTDA
jgi:diguanylate cyclase (GGDEF)-like protein/PAS domain S-box-containing protein